MAGSLDGVLANIPGLGGYLAKRQMNEQAPMQDLQQLGALAQLQAQSQAMQKSEQAAAQERQMRAELEALGPNPDQNALMRVASKYAPAQAILTSQTSSLDRQAARDAANVNAQAARDQRNFELQQRGEQEIARIREQAAQQRITREEADRREALMREQMAKLAASLRPQRNLQLTADEQGNQLIVNPDGTTRPLQAPGGGGVKKPVGTDKPMTEFQGKASLYGTRAAQSDKVLKALEDTVSTTGMEAKAKLGTVGNFMMSEAEQRVKQAQRDFVNAVLRQESGAVISDQEFANATKQYFPQPGDSQEVVAQKRANRLVAINGFSRLSGPKGAADIKAIIDEPLLPGISATTPTPQQSNQRPGGYVETRRTADGRLLGKKADGTIEEIRQ